MSWRSGMRDSRMFRVLVDMDSVLGDFEGHFLSCFRQRYPDLPYVTLDNRRHFYLTDDYKMYDDKFPEIQMKIRSIYETKGFFHGIPPVPGSVEAVKDMSSMQNVEVFICTSPLFKTRGAHYDAYDKLCWVEEHLGQDWVQQTIITKDKTVVMGDLLIDDKHYIKGKQKPPSWKHIIFSAPHNLHLDVKQTTAVERLDNWTDGTWKQVIEKYMKELV